MATVDNSSTMGIHPKVVYNFSIPEFINHEPREERTRAETRRKRNRLQQQQQQTSEGQHIQQQQHENTTPTQSEDRIEIHDSPVIVQATKKRRRAAAAAAMARANVVEADEEDDADCHRRPHVPVIDLTGIDSHDEFNSSLTESERRSQGERSSVIRPYPSYRHRQGLNHILSDIERSRRLSSRDHRGYYRSPSIQRLHRMQQLRRRHETHRNDNFRSSTDDLLAQEEGRTTVNNGDDSVLIVNEVRGPTMNEDEDQLVAQRLEEERTFSPPIVSYQSRIPTQLRSQSEGQVTNSYDLIQERLSIQRQRRELAMAEHSAHMEPLYTQEIQDALRSSGALRDHPLNSETTVQQPRREGLRQHERSVITERRTAPDNIAEEQTPEESGEVEFIGEWNVRNQPQTIRQRSSQHPLLPFHLGSPIIPYGLEHRHPFLRLLPTPPRLHHIFSHHENYEALLNLADTLGPGKPRGLEKAEIERIPSFRFSTSTAKETNIKCVVCISEYINREKLRRLPCSHDFHAKCIDKWLKSNKSCPVCRNEVKV